MIGEVLNSRYKITSEVGDGGMATVYRAVDLTLQREVAIKILHPHLAKDADLTARFYQEAAIAARIDHPNVMKIYDYGTHVDKRTYIVAELIRGRDFHKLQVEHSRTHDGEPFSPIVCAMFCEEALKGLAAAHALEVVHRDVKPDNVMIGDDGQVKLMDFGIAKNTSTSLTMTGHFLGSPSYASPEQVKGENVDARSDLYSMGIILYEALSNRLPFTGQSAPEVMMKICQGKYTALRQARPSVPQGLADIVAKALYVDRERRYRSAEGMLKELHDFLVECGVQSSRQGLEEYTSDAKRFLDRHTLPAQRPKLGKAGAKVSDLEDEAVKETKRSEPRRAQAGGVNSGPGTTEVALGRGTEWKNPREIAEALREQQRNAFAQTQQHYAPQQQNAPQQAQAKAPQRDFRATFREKAPRIVSKREAGNGAFRDTVRGASREESSFPTALLFVLLPALALFLGYLVFGGQEKSRAPDPSKPKTAERPTRERPNDNPSGKTGKEESKGETRNEPREPRPRVSAPSANDVETRPSRTPQRPAREVPFSPRKETQVESVRPAPQRPQPAPRRENPKPSTAPKLASGLASGSASGPASRPVAANSLVAKVSLQTIPGGVPVYLGSQLLGESSRNGTARTFESKPGPHLLRIPKQNVAGTRYEGLTRKVFLDAGNTLSVGVITLTPIRSLSVNITGPGVIVRINGDPYVLKGKPVVLNLAEGKVDVEARASNGKTLKRTIDLRGDNFALNASLE